MRAQCTGGWGSRVHARARSFVVGVLWPARSGQGRRLIKRRVSRGLTVVGGGEPEGIACPDGAQVRAVWAEACGDHVIDGVRLGGAPHHGVEPCEGLRGEEVRTEGAHVRARVHAAEAGRIWVPLVVEFGLLWALLGRAGRTEEECAVQVEDKQFS